MKDAWKAARYDVNVQYENASARVSFPPKIHTKMIAASSTPARIKKKKKKKKDRRTTDEDRKEVAARVVKKQQRDAMDRNETIEEVVLGAVRDPLVYPTHLFLDGGDVRVSPTKVTAAAATTRGLVSRWRRRLDT